MDKQISFKTRGTTYVSFKLKMPTQCIHCHKEVGFIVESTSTYDREVDKTLAVTFQCPSCNRYSVFEYFILNKRDHLAKLINYSYTKKIDVELPKNISKVSDEFVNIYEQAATAEAYNLINICGVAYRKAAEFLIKDYVITKNQKDEEKIKNMMLGNVISTYLNDFPKIQNLAKATAWIGNDETHYVRKHNDKDLQDLKAFLLATATFIAADYDADQAMEMVTK
ncbi:DUF4145 domain-containing protein [Lactococcus petauri]|uniref:DUF4145 domain-containing protein n=1 Tax=Lactococcus petauri TaxID=1940789 RepID=UPI0038553D7A